MSDNTPDEIDPANAIDELCRRSSLPRLPALDLATFQTSCPPLFEQPVVVPAKTALGPFADIDEMLKHSSIRHYFSVDRNGETRTITDAGGLYPYLRRQRMLCAAYQHWHGDRLDGLSVLDIGCSSGYYTLFASRLGAARAVGVDGRAETETPFNLVHGLLDAPSTCTFRLGDMEYGLESIEETFDIVLAQGVLYHVFDHPRFMRNLHRLTNKFLVLEGMASGRLDMMCRAVIERTEKSRLSIHGPALVPSIPWTVDLLRWTGFRDLTYVDPPDDAPDHWIFDRLLRSMIIARK